MTARYGWIMAAIAMIVSCSKVETPAAGDQPVAAPQPQMAANEQAEDPAPQYEKMPAGVRAETARLRDMQRVILVHARIEVPQELQRQVIADATGIIGRVTEAQSWPAVGTKLADCAPLMQLVADQQLPAALSTRRTKMRRRCAGTDTNNPSKGQDEGGRALTYRAPCEGWVLNAPHPIGKRIKAGTKLATIGCTGSLTVQAQADSTRPIDPQMVTAAWALQPEGLPPVQLSHSTGQQLAWPIPADDGHGIPGVALQVALAIGPGRPALAVPSAAVNTGEKRAFVLVQRPDQQISSR